MTVTIITRWESAWFDFESGDVTEFNLWDQTYNAYLADRLIFVPIQMPLSTQEEYDTLDEALNVVDGVGTKVFLESGARAIEIGREPVYLNGFVHPKDVVYVFGNSSTDNSGWVGKDDMILSIDTPDDIGMFATTVLGIVLYDRRVKNQ